MQKRLEKEKTNWRDCVKNHNKPNLPKHMFRWMKEFTTQDGRFYPAHWVLNTKNMEIKRDENNILNNTEHKVIKNVKEVIRNGESERI